MPFMYCDPPSKIVSIRPATDQSHAGSGLISLASGASFEITTPTALGVEGEFVVKVRKTDHIQLCYAPPQQWADAGPTARMAIIGDVENGAYMYALAYPAKH